MTLSTRRVTLWVLLALIAATLGLIFAVSHMSHSVWYDESLTDIIARQPTFGGLVKSAMDLKAYPPAFFVVVRWVYSVDDSPGGMRLPSAVFGFLATLAVFALGSIAGGSAVGALAGAFFVLTPGALRYFSDGNAYTLLMLASAVSTVCLYRALETDRRLHWILYGASAALGLATHTIFVFHLGGQIIAALWYRFVVKPNGTHRPPTGPMRMMLTMSVLLVLWLAWVAFYMISGGMTRAVSLSAIWSPAMLLAVPGMYAGPLSFGTLLPLALWLLLQLAGTVATEMDRGMVSRPGGTHCVHRKEALNCVAGPLVFRKPEFLCQFLHGAAERRRRVAAGSYAARIERAGCLIREAKRFLRVTVIGFECPR